MYCINCRNCIQAHCSLLCAFGAGISKTSPYTATFMFYLWSKSIECVAAHLLFLIMEHNQRICQTMIFTCVNQRKLSFPGIYVYPWPTHLSLTFTRPEHSVCYRSTHLQGIHYKMCKMAVKCQHNKTIVYFDVWLGEYCITFITERCISLRIFIRN